MHSLKIRTPNAIVCWRSVSHWNVVDRPLYILCKIGKLEQMSQRMQVAGKSHLISGHERSIKKRNAIEVVRVLQSAANWDHPCRCRMAKNRDCYPEFPTTNVLMRRRRSVMNAPLTTLWYSHQIRLQSFANNNNNSRQWLVHLLQMHRKRLKQSSLAALYHRHHRSAKGY